MPDINKRHAVRRFQYFFGAFCVWENKICKIVRNAVK